MKRRLLLLGGSLGAIVVVYLIYLAVTGVGGAKPATEPLERIKVERSRRAPSRGLVEPAEGTDFRTTDRDKEGRLQRVFSAPEYQRTDEGVYVLTQPKAVLYQDDGQQVQITAEQGTVHTTVLRSEPGSVRLSVTRGELRGNVRLYLDRVPPPAGPPVEQRVDDPNVLQIAADNVTFDNDRLLLYTNDEVRVSSVQMKLVGRGLSLQWNEDPQELRVLRLEEGEGLTIRSVPGQEEMELLALPRGGAKGAAPAQPPELPTTQQAIEIPMTVTVTTEPADVEPLPIPSHRGKNIYTATFYGDVQVNQGTRYIRGADSISMEFQWEQGSDDMGSSRRPPPTVTPGSLVAPPGAQDEPAAASVAATTEPSAPAERALGEPITITWSGPLEIVPTGYTDRPSQKNVAISGQGEMVQLFDGETLALCREFEFRRKVDEGGDRRLGYLLGNTTSPAVLSLAGGEEIVCRTMSFELSEVGDTARLEGQGYIVRPADSDTATGELLALRPGSTMRPSPAEISATTEGRDFEYISWQDAVDAVLVRDRSARGGAYIRQARFQGNVELSSGDERMQCGQLLVTVERLPAEESDGTRTVVDAVLAQDHVVVGGGSGQARWQAFADRLDGDPVEGTAVLYGAPAKLTSRQSYLAAEEIHFEAFKDADGELIRGAGLAHVPGPGEVQMLMDKDLSGTKLSTPRPATVRWDKEMRYVDYGSSRLEPQQGPGVAPATATFFGRVRLTSGDEEMTCGRMRVTFANSEAEETSPASPSGSRSVALPVTSYGGRLSKVFATQEVVLTSHRRDDAGRTRGLAELRTDSMVYDAVAETVDAQAGWLLVQDLRPPQTEDRSRTDIETPPLASGNLASPSQTYFEWYKTMHLSMDARLVELSGDVWMRHASGDAIVERQVLKTKWDIQDWPDPLPAGRLSDLRCDRLLARFAEPSEAKPNAPSPEPDNRLQTGLNLVGPLDLFVATGSVLLKDSPWEVVGEKLTYAREPDLVTVFGAVDGSDKANAMVSRKEADRVVTNESPWIRWYRKEDRIETGPMTGGGVLAPAEASQP